MGVSAEFVWFWRDGDISKLGEMIPRSKLPADAIAMGIHIVNRIGTGDPDAPDAGPTSLQAYAAQP
jgi:hypothetical protein